MADAERAAAWRSSTAGTARRARRSSAPRGRRRAIAHLHAHALAAHARTPGQATKLPLQVPVATGLLGRRTARPLQLEVEGDGAAATSRLLVREPSRSFVLRRRDRRPTASLLRGFSAPVRLDRRPRRRSTCCCLAHDSDPYSRWDAAQRLAPASPARGLAQRRAARLDAGLRRGDARALRHPALDPAFRRSSLTLPTEGVIADRVVRRGPARGARRAQVRGARAGRELPTARSWAFAPPWRSAATRSTRGRGPARLRQQPACCCLTAARRPGQGGPSRASGSRPPEHDRPARRASPCLVHVQRPGDSRLSSASTRCSEGDALVIDKWFTLQATAPRARRPGARASRAR